MSLLLLFLGGKALLSAAATSSLETLTLSNAELGPESGTAVVNLALNSQTLHNLDVSGNRSLFSDGGRAILKALQAHEDAELRELDVRRTNIDPTQEKAIAAIMKTRTEKFEQQRRKRVQHKDWDYMV